MIEVVTKDEHELDAFHAEAVAMLERALVMARDRKLEGVAITLVFADGSYGRILPTELCNAARLIGAAFSTAHDLTARTLRRPADAPDEDG